MYSLRYSWKIKFILKLKIQLFVAEERRLNIQREGARKTIVQL